MNGASLSLRREARRSGPFVVGSLIHGEGCRATAETCPVAVDRSHAPTHSYRQHDELSVTEDGAVP
jgi:hypothetical protein